MTTWHQPLRPSPLGGNTVAPPSSSPTSKYTMATPWPVASTSSCSVSSSSSPTAHRSALPRPSGGRRPYRPTATSAADRAQWHGRFLERCAKRLRDERAALLASKRSGFDGTASDEGGDEGEWSPEEEMLLRRKVLAESRRYQLAMQRASEEHDVLPESEMEDWDDGPPEDVDDDFYAAFADAIAAEERTLLQSDRMNLDTQPPPPPTLCDALLSSACPACNFDCQMHLNTASRLAGCDACGWHVGLDALLVADRDFALHAALNPSHRPFITFTPSVGTLCLCTACDEAIGLA